MLLHTEFMREHVLVERAPTHWAVTGLIDFGPAMTGAAEYDFVAVAVHPVRGDPTAWRCFPHGYGHATHPGPEFARRCLAYT